MNIGKRANTRVGTKASLRNLQADYVRIVRKASFRHGSKEFIRLVYLRERLACQE